MEEHFERVLAAASAAPTKRPAGREAHGDVPEAKRARSGASELSQREIAALVAAGERADVADVDARALKGMARALQRAVRQNALQREKHADEPARFMDSEVSLDAELARWRPVAANPALLYAPLVDAGVVPVLLGLLAHENMDIRLAVVSLLAELTDVDDGEAALQAARLLAAQLVQHKLLPLLVDNLFQFAAAARAGGGDGEQQPDEEAAGVFHALQILENLADVAPDTSAHVAADTPALQFLLLQLAPSRAFSQNKLYASEILSILLQSGAAAREAFLRKQPRHVPPELKPREKPGKEEQVDLMDELLQAMAPYRKKDPVSEEEEEQVENLVNALCSLLLVPAAQHHFRRLEGIELMLRCLKDRRLCMFPAALRVLDHATMDSARNCERLVQVGGLKSVFSVFMGKKSAKAPANKKVKRDKAKEQENVASIVASLCAFVGPDAEQDAFDRLHAKFVEGDMEKMDRLVDLFGKYLARVDSSTQYDEEEDEEDSYLRRLDAGLFVLQRIAFVVAHLCRFSAKLQAYVGVKFYERNIDMERLSQVLQEQLDLLVADTLAEDTAASSDMERSEEKEVQKEQLRALLAHLAAADRAGVKEDHTGEAVADEGGDVTPVKSEDSAPNGTN